MTRACATSREPVVRPLVRPEVTFPSAVTINGMGLPGSDTPPAAWCFSAHVSVRSFLARPHPRRRPARSRSPQAPRPRPPGLEEGSPRSTRTCRSRRGKRRDTGTHRSSVVLVFGEEQGRSCPQERRIGTSTLRRTSLASTRVAAWKRPALAHGGGAQPSPSVWFAGSQNAKSRALCPAFSAVSWEPLSGLEPETYGLRNRCSTD